MSLVVLKLTLLELEGQVGWSIVSTNEVKIQGLVEYNNDVHLISTI